MEDTDADEADRGLGASRNRLEQLVDEAALDAFCAGTDVVLVEFYTNGCGICQSMEPVLGNVARALDIRVGLINPRDDPGLIERFAVRSVPLLVLFVKGEPVARLEQGFVSGDELEAWIAEHAELS